MKLAVRATASFLALPFVVAGVVPAMIAAGGPPGSHRVAGVVVIAAGFVGLLSCVRDFYAAGRGTLAPWDPPRHLVRVGVYRWVRNPMYLCVITLVLGWALWYGSGGVALYGALLGPGFHLRVIFHEEPWLDRQFGESWRAYRGSVPRWIPRRPPP